MRGVLLLNWRLKLRAKQSKKSAPDLVISRVGPDLVTQRGWANGRNSPSSASQPQRRISLVSAAARDRTVPDTVLVAPCSVQGQARSYRRAPTEGSSSRRTPATPAVPCHWDRQSRRN